MAKDPATLWYWNDWQGGTVTLTRHLKGCYIDLLHAQFNNGRMSLSQIKTVLGVDFGASWPILQAKFKKDENDLYYNVRAEEEKLKRQSFVNSRKSNGLTGGRPKKPNGYPNGKPKNNLTENENENRNDTAIVVKNGEYGESVNGVFTDLIDKQIELTDLQIQNTITFVRITSKKTLTVQEVKDQWDAFKINQFYKHEWYSSFQDVVSHFQHSLKKQSNGTHKQTFNNQKPGTADDQNAAVSKW